MTPSRPLSRRQRRSWGVPPFGLRRRIFWSLVGAMVTAGLLTLALSLLWTKTAIGFHYRANLPLFSVAVFVMLSLWFASGRLAWRLVRPLNRLIAVVQRFGEGDLSARTGVSAGNRDDVARVAWAIDRMAERIERQVNEERKLLAVVSHELRTPLARMRVLTEIVRDGRLASLNDIDREIAEMDYLVSNLLARSRLDFGSLSKIPLLLTEAVSEALDRAGLDRSLLTVVGNEIPGPVLADPTLLHRAIANLIDNAQRHGNGLERIEVRRTSAGVSVDVLDRGPGFNEPDEKLRFTAFAPDGGGSHGQGLGLGLNLVQRIIAGHGGQVWARNRPDGGASAGFELPSEEID